MMRIFLPLIFFLQISSLFSQTPVLLGNEIDTKILPDYPVGVYSDNAGTPFVVYIADDSLFVKKYTGGTWQDSQSGLLDTNVKDFDVHHIPETDQTVLVYTKSDGVFVRSYSGSWSAASAINETISGNINNLLFSVDEENKLAYIIYFHWNGSTTIPRFVTYDLSDNTFDTFSVHPDFSNDPNLIAGSDIQFNQQNERLYLSYSSTSSFISSYDGSNWNNTDVTFNYQSVSKFKTEIRSSKMIIAELALSDPTMEYQYYKLSSLNTSDNISTTIEEINILDPNPFEPADITDIAISPLNNYAAFAFIKYSWHTAPSVLKVYNGQHIYTIDHGLGDNKIRNCGFDTQGRLLLATVYNETLKVYRMDTFILGLTDQNQTVDLSMYPNPGSEYLIISGQNMTNATVSICSISGQTMLSNQVENESEAVVNIKDLSAGVYFAHVQFQDGGKSVKQFIKK